MAHVPLCGRYHTSFRLSMPSAEKSTTSARLFRCCKPPLYTTEAYRFLRSAARNREEKRSSSRGLVLRGWLTGGRFRRQHIGEQCLTRRTDQREVGVSLDDALRFQGGEHGFGHCDIAADFRQHFAGVARQMDDPAELKLLEEQLAAAEAELAKIKG
jgi:hypothetical protein